MLHLDADCAREGDLTRVRVTVTNDRTTTQRVEIESTLDEPVWVPRSGPLTITEWTGSKWIGVVSPGQTRGIGFSTTACPSEDPVEIVSSERVQRKTASVDPVVETLDRASPPSELISEDP